MTNIEALEKWQSNNKSLDPGVIERLAYAELPFLQGRSRQKDFAVCPICVMCGLIPRNVHGWVATEDYPDRKRMEIRKGNIVSFRDVMFRDAYYCDKHQVTDNRALHGTIFLREWCERFDIKPRVFGHDELTQRSNLESNLNLRRIWLSEPNLKPRGWEGEIPESSPLIAAIVPWDRHTSVAVRPKKKLKTFLLKDRKSYWQKVVSALRAGKKYTFILLSSEYYRWNRDWYDSIDYSEFFAA